MARVVIYYHGAGSYACENPDSPQPQWGAETIYMLADAIAFNGMLEDFTVVNGGQFRAIQLIATDHWTMDGGTLSYTFLHYQIIGN